jgi:hypothetical protein
MTDKQRALRTGWGGLTICVMTFINMFTHNRFGLETSLILLVIAPYIILINLRK